MIIGSNTPVPLPANHPGTQKQDKAASRLQASSNAAGLAANLTSATAADAALANDSRSASIQAAGSASANTTVQNRSDTAGLRIESAEQATRFIEQVKQTLLTQPGVALVAQASQLSQHALRLLA